MAENDQLPENDRKNTKLRLEKLENAVQALLKGMQDAEKELGEPLMPEGEHYGIKFDN